ncbi:tRNA guanosine(34) transglycosylase Tgt [Paraliomyxa miuraensis]|uniref:tRNA guanosine(34) transglycosylase Tgt n=1 Tax=Paraliomyxa miuraensis TaxID=376150 RepID=UPI002257CB2B|nr:tRNA guanosine(34) transglycosylase Tgt [Paraliomyxa miuraensis]MCX4244641.1 tRNA guanosine(34) transglycosylase Tgt [Paraliomyxa miuraensis]
MNDAPTAERPAVIDPGPPDPALRPDPAAGLPADDPTLEIRPPGTFEVFAQAGPARAARLWTAHGPVDTPCFMPVGTYGAVKGLTPDELASVGSQVILGNAYHLTHRPGAALVRALGGLHGMTTWPRAILTDSGGFQVFSLRGLQTIDDEGVDYRTHFDGSAHRMTPRSVLEAQACLGSDICMVLDHCPPGQADAAAMGEAVARTTAWAREAAAIRGEILGPGQLCFGIVQGGTSLELRRAHLEVMRALPFDGLALGGLSVGEPIPDMHATLAAVAPLMPQDRPRYVMGIGTPHDLLAAVRSGVDMFDCVMPTRHARNAQLFTWHGRINLRWARLRDDPGPVDPTCGCLTCRRFSRAYLRHLHRQGEPLFLRLATLHNLYFFHQWVAVLRGAVRAGTFADVDAALSSVITRYYLAP